VGVGVAVGVEVEAVVLAAASVSGMSCCSCCCCRVDAAFAADARASIVATSSAVERRRACVFFCVCV